MTYIHTSYYSDI